MKDLTDNAVTERVKVRKSESQEIPQEVRKVRKDVM